MNIRSFLRDKQLLGLLIGFFGVTIITILLVLLGVDTTQSIAIVRNNTMLGIAGFEKADTSSLYQIVILAFGIFLVHTTLAIRLREKLRSYAVLTLSLGVVAQIFLVVVASSILNLNR
jgi:hypothetical protein